MQQPENQADSSSSIRDPQSAIRNRRIRILAEGLSFPEGPAFDRDGNLWCVELKGGNLVRYADTGSERFASGGTPNGLAFDYRGRAVFCDSERNAIRRFNPLTNEWHTIVDSLDGQPLNKPNDLAFDMHGNLVFTCPGDSREFPTGYVCCLGTDGSLGVIANRMFFPNGLAFADEGRSLVVAETYRQRLWKGAWGGDAAQWIDPQPFADVSGQPGPDGMALGIDGLLYVAIYGSGCVKAIDHQGRIARTFDLPGRNPTNVAFDPKCHHGLVVTEAERGLLLSLPELGPGSVLFDGTSNGHRL